MARKKTSVYFDEDLWRRFKSKCALEGVHISDRLEELVGKDIERERVK